MYKMENQHSPPAYLQDLKTTTRLGLIIIVVMFVGIGGWATLAPLSGAIIAPAILAIDGNRKTVQHLEGGIVKEILVHDGDHVKAGQALIILGDAMVTASVDLLQAQLDSELLKESRLKAEKSMTEFRVPLDLTIRKNDQKIQNLIQAEMQLFHTRRDSLNSQIALLHKQIVELQKEISGVIEQVKSEEQAISFMREDITSNEVLVNKQFVQKNRLLALKRDLSDHEALRSEHVADLSRAKQKVTELEIRIVNLRSNYMQQAADDLEASIKKIRDLQERLLPSNDALKRQVIQAPVDGTIVGLRVHTLGGVIGAREPILDIVPADNALIVEAKIGVNDIDEVKLGVATDIRFSAFNSRTMPLVTGKVSYVAADRTVDDRTQLAFYMVRIKADPDSLADTKEMRLTPGMPAEVFIKTRDRTALMYILEPITDVLRRTMRES